jgi:hypothetical protein
MIDNNRWTYQINHVESIRHDALYSDKIKNLDELEHSEYMDLERRKEEQLLDESPCENPICNTKITSNKYA